MTLPRSEKIDLDSTPYYLCTSRCVRRSYLFGTDKLTNKNYDHRKQWIIDRIKYLSEIFAINICAYAVMSNHYHLVLYVNTELAKNWPDEEVLIRWGRLFPNNADEIHQKNLSPDERRIKISSLRERLFSISWYMRCINQTLAEKSNAEDNCSGRFWEGRFNSKALLDEGAVLAAMAYVDLNPIRSKQADRPENSLHTSIYERISTLKFSSPLGLVKKSDLPYQQPEGLMPFETHSDTHVVPFIPFDLYAYLELVDQTGRIIRNDKPGTISENLKPILERLNFSHNGWLNIVQSIENNFLYSVGKLSALYQFSLRFRKRPARGLQMAKACYLKSA